ncbi:hypothetical protein [Rathayibacter festucae]
MHWDGFSIAEAATLIHVPAPTARARYGRARLLLRTELTEHEAGSSRIR